MIPSYLKLHETQKLQELIDTFQKKLSACELCPHKCNVNRLKGEKGTCKSGVLPIVSSYSPHYGEESCLVGRGGSGTIFFTFCNLHCIYCQNYDISQDGVGREVSHERLAEMMLELQQQGCHNINFVSPSHMTAAILTALPMAIEMGLKIPLVYNSGGYDSVETLQLLEGIIDIYMPDFKYMDSEIAHDLSGVEDYPQIVMNALREMHRQVGDLVIDHRGIAEKGLLVRHLVLPNNIASSDRIVRFLADLSKNTYVNIMNQFRPEYRAYESFNLKRRVTLDEYDEVVNWARLSGLNRLDKQF